MSTRANTPISVKLQNADAGLNLTTISDFAFTPEPNQRIYKAAITKHGHTEGECRIVVPESPGDHTIPSFTLWYFDPQALSYKQVRTEAIPITVTPTDRQNATKEDVSQQFNLQPHYLKAITHLKEAPKSPQNGNCFG